MIAAEFKLLKILKIFKLQLLTDWMILVMMMKII